MHRNNPTQPASPSPRKLPLVTLLIAALSLAAACVPSLPAVLQYDRPAIASGQVWRLVTCHATHFNLDHLVWDLGVFVLLGAICERRHLRAFLACLGLSAAIIPLGVLWLMPQMMTYRGLSGIDTALFTLLGIWLLQSAIERRQWLSVAVVSGLMVGAVGKVCFELATGNTLFVNDTAAGFTPLPLAHILGAAAGMAIAIFSYAPSSPRKSCQRIPSLRIRARSVWGLIASKEAAP